MEVSWAGLLVVALGAAMQGSFALPQKFIRGWAWERCGSCIRSQP
jgi:hypothetical protein